MGTRGGYRPNAGRPKGSRAPHTIEAEQVRKIFVKGVKKEAKPILNALIVSAIGFWYEEKMPHGKKIYQTKPDVLAAKYLYDQVIGRAKETAEITGKGGEPIKIDFQGMDVKQLDAKLKEILKR